MAAPLPPYILDALFASLDPLRARLSTVYAKVYAAWAPSSTKSGWISSLNQASKQLEHASIEGQLGQRLAMGDADISAWRTVVNTAADLVEYVAREVGMASYSIRRAWNEIVVPTVTQAGQLAADTAQKAVSWGPIVALGVLGLVLFVKLK